jgi:hypothetical protein
MPGILQEKFQVDNPQQRNDDAHSGWKSDSSARRAKREAPTGTTPMPPGMNIQRQAMSDQRPMKSTTSGESDVSADFNSQSAKSGFKRLPMRGTDDEYSNAHVDAFYDEMTVEGETGFAERNNVLDRM